MDTGKNIAAVKLAYEAFRRADIKAILAIMNEDISWTTPGQRELIPFAGQFKGRSEVARWFEALASSEVVLTFEPHEFVAEGDSVVAFVHYWARAKATGKTHEGEGVHFFQFQNGKISSFREFFDPVSLASGQAFEVEQKSSDPIHCKFCN
jgi:uncharacterized protein